MKNFLYPINPSTKRLNQLKTGILPFSSVSNLRFLEVKTLIIILVYAVYRNVVKDYFNINLSFCLFAEEGVNRVEPFDRLKAGVQLGTYSGEEN